MYREWLDYSEGIADCILHQGKCSLFAKLFYLGIWVYGFSGVSFSFGGESILCQCMSMHVCVRVCVCVCMSSCVCIYTYMSICIFSVLSRFAYFIYVFQLHWLKTPKAIYVCTYKCLRANECVTVHTICVALRASSKNLLKSHCRRRSSGRCLQWSKWELLGREVSPWQCTYVWQPVNICWEMIVIVHILFFSDEGLP